jgi:hypothetical protein
MAGSRCGASTAAGSAFGARAGIASFRCTWASHAHRAVAVRSDLRQEFCDIRVRGWAIAPDIERGRYRAWCHGHHHPNWLLRRARLCARRCRGPTNDHSSRKEARSQPPTGGARGGLRELARRSPEPPEPISTMQHLQRVAPTPRSEVPQFLETPCNLPLLVYSERRIFGDHTRVRSEQLSLAFKLSP